MGSGCLKNHMQIHANTKNLTKHLAEILKTAGDAAETVIEFEKSTYHIGADGCGAYPIFASGSSFCDGRPKKTAFPLISAKNITIDGGGADFVFCDRIQPFFVQACENVTLKNFSIDFSFLRYAFAEVRSADAEGFEIFLDRSLFDYTIVSGDIVFACGSEHLSTKDLKISTKAINRKEAGIVFLYSENATDVPRNQAAPNVLFCAEERGDGRVYIKYIGDTRKAAFLPGDLLCFAYDNDRETQAFFCENSKNIRLENVRIYRQGGMGFVADVCEDITIDNLQIKTRPERHEYYPTTADGVFLTNCRGRFVLRNSEIRSTYDDAMNIHGFYMEVIHVPDKNRIELAHTFHAAHRGIVPLREGDVLYFSDPESMHEVCTAKVKAFTFDAETRDAILVTLEEDAPILKGMIVENRSSMPEVHIENNKITDCPHMRLSSKNMVIKNNTLSLRNADIYIDDLFTFWAEGGAVENVLIEGNVFGGTAYKNIQIHSCRPERANRQHRAITIQNNVFVKREEDAICKEAPVKTLVLENNVFEGQVEL